MPRLIDPGPAAAPLALDEAVEALTAMRFDPHDEGAWDAAAPVLAGLSANRTFLGALAADALAGRGGRSGAHSYGPQVLMLHRGEMQWFLRANLWLAEDDPVLRASGRTAFFYDVPHDHNFSFLTIGHHGPGYESDYWRYDHEGVRGLPGEAVALRYEGRRRLEPGRMMLYRAHADIHDQKPPASFSISLNLMAATGREPWRDQYRFDTQRGTIISTMNAVAIEGLVALAAHCGGGEGEALVRHVATRHPVDRIRFGAILALAGAAADAAGRHAVWSQAAARADRYVAARARAALAEVERAARWDGETDASPLDGVRLAG